jgi:sulfate transport system permease protein
VRAAQPVIAELDPHLEEAASTLGASRLATVWRVLFPQVKPALLAGGAMAFARAVGEYGSVIFISGNLPGNTEIAPLLIVTRLEQFDYHGAAVLGVAMLVLSFAMLLIFNVILRRIERRAHGIA